MVFSCIQLKVLFDCGEGMLYMEGGLFMHAFSHKIYLMALNISFKLSVISESARCITFFL